MAAEYTLELKELVIHRADGLPMQVYRTSDVYYHWHEEYEFLFLKEGTAHCVINGQHITLTPGQMLLVQGGVLHMYRVDTPQVMTAVVVHPSLWHGEAHEELFGGQVMFQQLFTQENSEEATIMDGVQQVVALLQEKPFGYAYRIEAALTGIFAHMIAHGMYIRGNFQPPKEAIVPMLAYIHQQYGSPLTLEGLAAQFHYSKSYIIQLFRRHTGLTPIEYLKRYRLETARRALREKGGSVLEVALRCGFPNVGYFIRSFKAFTGMTPGAYRRERGRIS